MKQINKKVSNAITPIFLKLLPGPQGNITFVLVHFNTGPYMPVYFTKLSYGWHGLTKPPCKV
jgi:hypothetical protein